MSRRLPLDAALRRLRSLVHPDRFFDNAAAREVNQRSLASLNSFVRHWQTGTRRSLDADSGSEGGELRLAVQFHVKNFDADGGGTSLVSHELVCNPPFVSGRRSLVELLTKCAVPVDISAGAGAGAGAGGAAMIDGAALAEFLEAAAPEARARAKKASELHEELDGLCEIVRRLQAAERVECDDESHCDAGVEGMRALARLLPSLPEQRKRPLASLEVTCVGANEDAHSIDPTSGAVGIGILAPLDSVRDMLLSGDFDAARRAHAEHQRASAERKQKEKRTHRARTILCTRAARHLGVRELDISRLELDTAGIEQLANGLLKQNNRGMDRDVYRALSVLFVPEIDSANGYYVSPNGFIAVDAALSAADAVDVLRRELESVRTFPRIEERVGFAAARLGLLWNGFDDSVLIDEPNEGIAARALDALNGLVEFGQQAGTDLQDVGVTIGVSCEALPGGGLSLPLEALRDAYRSRQAAAASASTRGSRLLTDASS